MCAIKMGLVPENARFYSCDDNKFAKEKKRIAQKEDLWEFIECNSYFFLKDSIKMTTKMCLYV